MSSLWGAWDNVRYSSWAHWKACSGLSISVNWTFSLGVTAEALRPNIMSVKYCLPVPVFHFWPKLYYCNLDIITISFFLFSMSSWVYLHKYEWINELPLSIEWYSSTRQEARQSTRAVKMLDLHSPKYNRRMSERVELSSRWTHKRAPRSAESSLNRWRRDAAVWQPMSSSDDCISADRQLLNHAV